MVICVRYEGPVTGYPKPSARDDVSTLDRYPGGRAPPTSQGVDFRPGAWLRSVSGGPGPRKSPERGGHTFVITRDKEGLAETISGEEHRKPMKEFRATAIPAGAIARALLPSVCLGLSSLSSCTPDEPVPPPPGPGRVTQVSVINALLIGRYGGGMPIPELLRYGEFGVGTPDHLDGELIVLDGRAYQARGDRRGAVGDRHGDGDQLDRPRRGGLDRADIPKWDVPPTFVGRTTASGSPPRREVASSGVSKPPRWRRV
jgi:hypothetical protein